ncbi:MAG: alpha-amylase family glycosyl hydrolase [Muribaculum sp.]|nr:alpha-amylase family glycosyl hydrolase [Muribaculum sp.]
MKSPLKICLCALALLAVPCMIWAKPKKKSVQLPPASAPAPEWIQDAVIYEVNLRQGTPERNLRGMQKQLPRLKDLGVDVLWLMPIHPISEKNRKGSLGSYYAVKDYKAVNPEFGTLEDLKEFVRTAHSLGMKVILDEVCNHTGADNIWVTQHPEYYARDKKGNFISPYDWTDVYKLDYSKPETRAAMTDALKFWIEEADIDGYRCDVAGEVPTDYWNEATAQLRAVKPVFMLAEASKPELLVSAFNADYAWPMKDLFNAIAASKGVNKWAVDKQQNLPAAVGSDIFALIKKQEKEYPAGSIHMNMVTNHDLNSWEGTEFDRYGNAMGTFAVLAYTLPGIPMLYTGQEVGFNHAFEFFELDSVTPDYTPNAFTSFYEMLNALKHNHPALNANNPEGEMTQWQTINPDVVAFTRTAPHDKVTVVANLSNDDTQITFPDLSPNVDSMVNYFTGAPAELPTHLGPWEYAVIVTP